MNLFRPLFLATTTLAVALSYSHAAPIAGVTYTYDNTGALNLVNGFDSNYGGALDASRGGLTDGLGLAGIYTPGTQFYASPELGMIYNHLAANIPGSAQPQITFDLGAVHDLSSVDIHYGVHHSFAVYNPSSVDVLVDGNNVGNFTGFVDSATQTNNTILQNSIDLTGQSGQMVTLQIRGRNPLPLTEEPTHYLLWARAEWLLEEEEALFAVLDRGDSLFPDDPRFPDLRLQVRIAQYERKLYQDPVEVDAVVQSLETLVSLAPDDLRVVNCLGFVCQDPRFQPKAKRFLTHIHERPNTPSDTFRFLGDISVQDDDLIKAVAWYERAIECSPKQPSAKNNLACCLLKQTS